MEKKFDTATAMNEMQKELWDVMNETDYTDYECEVFYDDEHKAFIIPKPVMALLVVNPEVRAWVMDKLSQCPNCRIVII